MVSTSLSPRLTSLLLGAALIAASAQTYACSVCIAHALGSAIHSIGSQTLPKGMTVVGLTFTTISKSQDAEEDEGGGDAPRLIGRAPGDKEAHKEAQYDLQIQHGLTDSLLLRLDVPYLYKRLSETGLAPIDTNGLGDISLGTTYQIKPRYGDKVLLAVSADIKFATGANNIKDGGGARLDEHSQVGTGSTDFQLGIVGTSDTKSGDLIFAGISLRFNGANKTGYRYGNAFFYNVGYSHRLTNDSSIVLEFNGRAAAKDHVAGGGVDDNSGGQLGYLSMSYRRSLGGDFGLVGTYQIPVMRALNGSQSESGLLTIGIFKRI